MRGLAKRIARLEKVLPDEQRLKLVLLHGVGRDPESITGIDGLDDHPRLDGECVADFLARVGAYVRVIRRQLGPLVTFARYGDDDEPDGPREPEPDDEEVLP